MRSGELEADELESLVETPARSDGGTPRKRRGEPPRAARGRACASCGGALALALCALGLVAHRGHAVDRLNALPALATPITLVTLATYDFYGSKKALTLPDKFGWPPSAAEAGRAYEANWRCYAALHGYQLFIGRTLTGAFPATDRGLEGEALAYWSARPGAPPEATLRLPPPYHSHWMKVELLQRYLPWASWIVWFDADALFISLPSRLEDLIERVATPGATDVIATVARHVERTPSEEMGLQPLCSCMFAVRNSEGGRWFLSRWWALRKQSLLWGGGDQGAFQHAIVEMHLRYARARADGRRSGGAPSAWHSDAFANVTSPCLKPHWSMADDRVDHRCLGRVLRALERTEGLPAAGVKSEWPVAWTSNLAGEFQHEPETHVKLNVGATERKLMRAGARGEHPPHPRLIAHTKSGVNYPLMSYYHRGALPALVRTCPAALACAPETAFVRGALLSPTAREYAPPAQQAGARCRGRRGDSHRIGFRASVEHYLRVARVYVEAAWPSRRNHASSSRA